MEAQNAVNSTKLAEYERFGVDGFMVINSCTEGTTPLCRDLGGCDGDSAVAWFDADDSISEQLEAHTSDARLFDGFDPLPPVPPFHFGCTSEIVPATRPE
jgi:hypothetical protein